MCARVTHMLLPFLPLLAPDDVADTLKRCNACLNSTQTLSVRIKAKSNRIKGVGIGSLAFKRPGSLKYVMNWGDEQYVFWGTRRGGLEIEQNSRSYCEVPPGIGFFAPPCRVSDIPEACFPMFLLGTDVAKSFPKAAKFTVTRNAPFEHGTADHVHATIGGAGSFSADLFVRKDGFPVGYKVDIDAPGISVHSSIVLSDVQANKALAASTFEAKIPRGFLPETFDAEPPPIQSGAPMPLTGWKDLRSGAPADLAKEPPAWRVFAVMAADCLPSREALQTLRRLSASTPVVILSTNPSPAQSWPSTDLPIYYDAKGDSLAKLSAPGTPLFILVDGQGVVRRVWYGFDPAQSDAFLKSIGAEASGASSPSK